MFEFEVGGRKYQADKMDAFQQFHVVRRLGSLVPNILSALEMKDKNMVMSLTYVATGLSRLSDADSNYILNSCLGITKIYQGTVWAQLLSPQGTLMFQDLDLKSMMEICWKVLEANLGPFIKGLLAKVSVEAEARKENLSTPLKV